MQGGWDREEEREEKERKKRKKKNREQGKPLWIPIGEKVGYDICYESNIGYSLKKRMMGRFCVCAIRYQSSSFVRRQNRLFRIQMIDKTARNGVGEQGRPLV